MARSVRHSPFIGHCATSDREFKQQVNRRHRHECAVAIAIGADLPKSVKDDRRSDKDGKGWIDIAAYPHLMRK